jgi:hypothetical protein
MGHASIKKCRFLEDSEECFGHVVDAARVHQSKKTLKAFLI